MSDFSSVIKLLSVVDEASRTLASSALIKRFMQLIVEYSELL